MRRRNQWLVLFALVFSLILPPVVRFALAGDDPGAWIYGVERRGTDRVGRFKAFRVRSNRMTREKQTLIGNTWMDGWAGHHRLTSRGLRVPAFSLSPLRSPFPIPATVERFVPATG